jgi:hypothetical protein
MKTLAAILLVISGAAMGQPTPGDMPMPNTTPEVRQVGQVSLLNGGVGEDEVRWFKAQSGQYPLQVVISGRGGEYGVADTLTLWRGDEELATLTDAGPWVMLDVPPGRYTVEMSFDGRTERRVVQVPGKGVQRIQWSTLKASD